MISAPKSEPGKLPPGSASGHMGSTIASAPVAGAPVVAALFAKPVSAATKAPHPAPQDGSTVQAVVEALATLWLVTPAPVTNSVPAATKAPHPAPQDGSTVQAVGEAVAAKGGCVDPPEWGRCRKPCCARKRVKRSMHNRLSINFRLGPDGPTHLIIGWGKFDEWGTFQFED